MCAAMANDGLLLNTPLNGSYNTERLIAFLEQGEPVRNPQVFVIVCDNVAFHHSAAVTDWFAAHRRFMVLYLPAYSPFLNPIE